MLFFSTGIPCHPILYCKISPMRSSSGVFFFLEITFPFVSLNVILTVMSTVGMVKEEPREGREGREDYLEAVSPERSLAADEAYSDADQEQGEGEEGEQEEEEDMRTEGSVPEDDEEEDDEGEDEEMEEGRGVVWWEKYSLQSQMDTKLETPFKYSINRTQAHWTCEGLRELGPFWTEWKKTTLLWHAASINTLN